MSRVFRVRLSQALDEALVGFCQQWNLSVSAAIRLAVTHLMHYPEEVIEQLASGVAPVADPRTPAQVEAWARLEAALERIDLEALMRQIHDPGA